MTSELAALTKPVSKLIAAVRSATGVLYEPTRIRRRAKAESDALVLRTKAEIEAAELAQRAAARLSYLELRRQENIDSITESAIGLLPEDVSEEETDDDWMVHFFRLAQDVSDEQIQQLWAKILANEVATSGSFSLRTLQVLQTLSRDDARLFEDYCQLLFCVTREEHQEARQVSRRNPTKHERVVDSSTTVRTGRRYMLFLFPNVSMFLADRGFSHDTLNHLRNLGLVNFREDLFQVGAGRKLYLTYGGKRYTLEDQYAVKGASSYSVQALTDIGCQLADIIEVSSDDLYLTTVSDDAALNYQLLMEYGEENLC